MKKYLDKTFPLRAKALDAAIYFVDERRPVTLIATPGKSQHHIHTVHRFSIRSSAQSARVHEVQQLHAE